MTERATLLVVEDDSAQREQLVGFLGGARLPVRLDVRAAADVPEARAALDAGGVDVVVTDVRLPNGDGIELVRHGRERHPHVDFVVVTAHGSVETAVAAMREGAHDFLTKPIDLDVLEQRLARLFEKRSLAREVRTLRERKDDVPHAAGIVAESGPMRDVLRVVRRVAGTDGTVLVTGESGTGKELVAELVHAWSRRAHAPLLRVNCGALPESLLESELFGHVRGAFTGAHEDRLGLFREADGGTLFLDEIGEVSPAVQVRLLRVLQEKEVRPVGGARPVNVDVRVVAATNRDLAADVEEGRFRADLRYRLDALTVRVPPLRERPEDVTALVPVLLRRFAEELGVPPPRVGRDVHDALLAHRWPGNVRELQNVLQRAVVLCASDVLGLDDLPASVRDPRTGDELDDDAASLLGGRPLPEVVASIEQRAIRAALTEHGGVRARAARALGIPERVLRYKLKTYGIDPTKLSGSRQSRRGTGR